MPRSALVTGGSSGIGLAIARTLREEGYELTLASRTQAKVEAAAAKVGAVAVAADVRKEEDCRRLVEAHVERCGGIDVLVNSAGVGVAADVDRLETKHVDLQIDVNLRAVLVVTREALPHLRRSHGLVVNVASIAGTSPAPGLAVYSATKAGVVSFTRSLNIEGAVDGIRATAICPGFVDTPMAEWTGMPGEEMIQPEDCAEVVRMLLRLSPRARIPTVVIERLVREAPDPRSFY